MANLIVNVDEKGNINIALMFLNETYRQKTERLDNGELYFSETIEEAVKAETGNMICEKLSELDVEDLFYTLEELPTERLESIGDNIRALTEYEEMIRGDGSK